MSIRRTAQINSKAILALLAALAVILWFTSCRGAPPIINLPPVAPNLSVAQAGNAALVTWDANTEADLAGYNVYYGAQSKSYDVVVNAGNATSKRIDGLLTGQWFFAVTAYDDSGNESFFSEEVSLTLQSEPTRPVRPVITVPVDSLILSEADPMLRVALNQRTAYEDSTEFTQAEFDSLFWEFRVETVPGMTTEWPLLFSWRHNEGIIDKVTATFDQLFTNIPYRFSIQANVLGNRSKGSTPLPIMIESDITQPIPKWLKSEIEVTF